MFFSFRLNCAALVSATAALGGEVGARLRATALLLCACFALNTTATGATPAAPAETVASDVPGADLKSINDWLRLHSPELKAREFDATAASERIDPAGALPDPMAEIELDGIDFNRPRALPAQVDTTVYRVRQSFPLWGKRALSREIAEFEADAAGQMRDATLLDLLEQADTAYLSYWHAAESARALDRVIELLANLAELAQSRYASGLVPQQDAIQAQVETTRMRRDLIERNMLGREAAATLNMRLGRSPTAELAVPAAAPVVPVSATLDELLATRAPAHPMVQAQTAMAAAADSMATRTLRERYPDLSVSLGLMQVGNRAEGWELMFGVEIPLQQGTRRHREREAVAQRDAALAREEAALADVRGRIGEAWVRWSSAVEQRRLIENTLLPQAEASFQSALSSYQVGNVDFGTLLEALREWRGADLDRIDALRDELRAAISVRAIQGSLEELP